MSDVKFYIYEADGIWKQFKIYISKDFSVFESQLRYNMKSVLLLHLCILVATMVHLVSVSAHSVKPKRLRNCEGEEFLVTKKHDCNLRACSARVPGNYMRYEYRMSQGKRLKFPPGFGVSLWNSCEQSELIAIPIYEAKYDFVGSPIGQDPIVVPLLGKLHSIQLINGKTSEFVFIRETQQLRRIIRHFSSAEEPSAPSHEQYNLHQNSFHPPLIFP
ncbi:hypothetical protein ACOME3_009931 [Neoechinorhynchus agilis]